MSHGAMIHAWLAARTGNVGVEDVRRRPLTNTGVVVLQGSTATGWELLSWHDRSGAEQH